MERTWLKEALFGGMTSNAFKLGTVLSLGWFWMRPSGCAVLYRGGSIETVDFSDILVVDDFDVTEIAPPTWLQHNSNSMYFYVVRRVNSCGQQEHTLGCAVRVVIDANGDLAASVPNDVFQFKAKQVAGNKAELVWCYCPIEQKSQPVCFKIYYDNRSGQIDYENPISTINYAGRKFYSHQTDALQAGEYLFAIRTEDASGVQNNSLAQLSIHIDTTGPGTIQILNAEHA